MPGQHWAKNFSIGEDDLDYLSGILLEKETPLKIEDLARELVARRLQQEADALAERYANIVPYLPARTFQVGEKVIFPALDYAVGAVTGVRDGLNPDLGAFKVMQVRFDAPPADREFAFDLPVHALNDSDEALTALPGANTLTVDDIMRQSRGIIIETLERALQKAPDLVSVAGHWFPASLMLDVNQGHLNLAEAVLDISGGGPMPTEELLREVGGLGSAPVELQIFSFNYALNQDDRFDEVGPVDTVLWFLRRLEPADVVNVPMLLRTQVQDYDRALLSAEMVQLEDEIEDEWSTQRDIAPGSIPSATLSLSYPHRRAGTLPLNARMRAIFPTARRTPRVYVTVRDGQDGEEYAGWVVRQDRYVLGLANLYRKHKLPVGVKLTVRAADEPDTVIVDFNSHKARTEYVPLMVPKDGRLTFAYERRSIGAEYDELMILGAEDLAAVDALVADMQKARRPLSGLLGSLISELSRTSPQGTVHAKTLYSAINVMRRLPPGPVFAALVANPDFEHVGSHYWRLGSR